MCWTKQYQILLFISLSLCVFGTDKCIKVRRKTQRTRLASKISFPTPQLLRTVTSVSQERAPGDRSRCWGASILPRFPSCFGSSASAPPPGPSYSPFKATHQGHLQKCHLLWHHPLFLKSQRNAELATPATCPHMAHELAIRDYHQFQKAPQDKELIRYWLRVLAQPQVNFPICPS